MLLQYMQNVTFLFLVGVHMLLASMICMSLIYKRWDNFPLSFLMVILWLLLISMLYFDFEDGMVKTKTTG